MKYIRIPFADQGDRVDVPDTDPLKGVNMTAGYGSDYSLDPRKNKTTAKRIERDKFNGLVNLITKAIQEIQQMGIATWIKPEENNGNPYTYQPGAVVSHDGKVFKCISSTAEEPPNAGWEEIIKADFDPIYEALAKKYDKTGGIIDGGVEIKGQLGVEKYAQFKALLECMQNFIVNGNATFFGQVDITGQTNINGGLMVAHGVEIGGQIGINGYSNIRGIMECSKDLIVNGQSTLRQKVTIQSDIDMAGTIYRGKNALTLSDEMLFTGSGFRINGNGDYKNIAMLPDGNIQGDCWKYFGDANGIYEALGFVDGKFYGVDEALSKKYDKTGGIIDGGVEIKGQLGVEKYTEFKALLECMQNFIVNGNATFFGTVDITGQTNLNSGLRVGQGVEIGGQIGIDGYSNIRGIMECSKDFIVNGQSTLRQKVTIQSDIDMAGTIYRGKNALTLSDEMLFTGSGFRINGNSGYKNIVLLPDGNIQGDCWKNFGDANGIFEAINNVKSELIKYIDDKFRNAVTDISFQDAGHIRNTYYDGGAVFNDNATFIYGIPDGWCDNLSNSRQQGIEARARRIVVNRGYSAQWDKEALQKPAKTPDDGKVAEMTPYEMIKMLEARIAILEARLK